VARRAFFVLTRDICIQACIFWLFVLAVTLLNIASCIQSTLWLSHQPYPTFLGSGVQWSYMTRLCGLWAAQQFVNLLLLPMLNLRKFNGEASERCCPTYTKHASHTPHATFATGPSCGRGLFKHAPWCRSWGALPINSRWCVLQPERSCSGIRFFGNSIYVLYNFFIVSAHFGCIPAEFPANMTTLFDNLNACIQQPQAKDVVVGLMEYVCTTSTFFF
jgi:hypothetical protein